MAIGGGWGGWPFNTGGGGSSGGEYAWQRKMLGTMGGPSYGVGWGGQGGQQLGVGAPVGGDPNAGWGAALQDAYKQSQGSYDQALKALGNSFSQGPWGQGLQSMFFNPKGISDEAYSGWLRMIRDREAGSRGNALEAAQNQGAATGFGNSLGLTDALGRIRTQSAANLNEAELQAMLAREQSKLGQQSMAGGLLGQLYGIDANQQQSLAQLLANRPFQAFAPTQPYQGTPGVPYGQPWSLPGGGM